MGFSLSHLLLLLIIVLVIFGAGKLPQVMADIAKGVKAFKEGLSHDAPPSKKSPPSDSQD